MDNNPSTAERVWPDEMPGFVMEIPSEKYGDGRDDVLQALLEAGWSNEQAEQMIGDIYQEEDEPRFAVTDISSADWVLRKMAECQEEIKQISQRTQDEVARITAKADKLTNPIRRKLDFFAYTYLPQLEEFARAEATRTGKKTVKGLYGEVCIKAGSKSLEWVGSEADIRPLIASRFPEAVQTVITHQLMKNPVKNALTKGDFDGYIDGVQVARINTAEDKIEVKPCLP